MSRFRHKFNSANSDWETPQWLFDLLDNEFHFTCDVAANNENAKVAYFIDSKRDALAQDWHGVCWLNPPYGRGIEKWVQKAYEESQRGALVVMLVPARTNTLWWHKYCMKASEIRFLLGRPKFGNAKYGLPQPLAIVIFRDKWDRLQIFSLDIRGLEKRGQGNEPL